MERRGCFWQMEANSEITLTRDTNATLIPAGDPHVLPAGTPVSISQALGGTVTVRSSGGLYRIASNDLDALGESARERFAPSESGDEAGSDGAPFGEEQVWNAMKACYDPEIPVNIVDLGLIYDLRIAEAEDRRKHDVSVKMTLTAQGCGMGPVIADDARQKIEALPAVREARVDIVWDPPWTPHMISEEGRKKLGLE